MSGPVDKMGRGVVTVRFFAVLRERVGTPSIEIAYSEPLTVEGLLTAVQELHPAIEPFRDYVRVAVNKRYAGLDQALSAGDEVAFITPVSGG